MVRDCDDRTMSNVFKLKEGRYILDIQNKFFTHRVVKHWNRFPREAVDATWEVSLSVSGGLELDDL